MSSGEFQEAVPAYFLFDTESVPDGKLIAKVRYPGEDIAPEEAIQRAQAKALENYGSDFLALTMQYPIAVCVLRVGEDFSLQRITCLDAPQYRPRKIVESFWAGVGQAFAKYRGKVRLVTFNGRGFDLPLMEMAAFRYGVQAREYFFNRKRVEGWHVDLMDWLTNYSAYRMSGGLNLLSKLLGKPGKMEIKGDQVHQLHRDGKIQEINDYCMFDTLDTYFVFLRTRVLTGELSLEQEHIAVLKAKQWLQGKVAELPGLQQYLDNWGDWNPWP
ncbi:MAG: 3'-5' exonuclease [Gemmataceae bacterium]|nr:3'-5' exonuclease [Gemmataceae bacterium]